MILFVCVQLLQIIIINKSVYKCELLSVQCMYMCEDIYKRSGHGVRKSCLVIGDVLTS